MYVLTFYVGRYFLVRKPLIFFNQTKATFNIGEVSRDFHGEEFSNLTNLWQWFISLKKNSSLCISHAKHEAKSNVSITWCGRC